MRQPSLLRAAVAQLWSSCRVSLNCKGENEAWARCGRSVNVEENVGDGEGEEVPPSREVSVGEAKTTWRERRAHGETQERASQVELHAVWTVAGGQWDGTRRSGLSLVARRGVAHQETGPGCERASERAVRLGVDEGPVAGAQRHQHGLALPTSSGAGVSVGASSVRLVEPRTPAHASTHASARRPELVGSGVVVARGVGVVVFSVGGAVVVRQRRVVS